MILFSVLVLREHYLLFNFGWHGRFDPLPFFRFDETSRLLLDPLGQRRPDRRYSCQLYHASHLDVIDALQTRRVHHARTDPTDTFQPDQLDQLWLYALGNADPEHF